MKCTFLIDEIALQANSILKASQGQGVSLGLFSCFLSAGGGSRGRVLWLELYQGDLLVAEALVTNPLGVYFLCEEVEGSLC